jgi:hypothetical protein
MSLGVGWLALLILRKRQCEGLNVGIGAEEQTPTSFLFPGTNMIKAEFGSQEAGSINSQLAFN